MVKLILKDEAYAIVGAAMEVHKDKGFGFLEAVYQECMEMELAAQGIPAVPLQEMPIFYKGRKLKKTYIADFVAYGKIIVELKALDKLTSREEAQVLNYLRASGFEIGILINFGGPSLEFKRIVRTERGAEPVDLQAGVNLNLIRGNSRNSRITSSKSETSS
jgi:GxxExxY protein